jgi:large subunit ribosomal protein L31
MKQDLHPEYAEVGAKCSCGNVLTINSVLKESISIDVCSRCHPVYTGKQKTIDAGGRVERYRKRFGSTAKTMEVGGS